MWWTIKAWHNIWWRCFSCPSEPEYALMKAGTAWPAVSRDESLISASAPSWTACAGTAPLGSINKCFQWCWKYQVKRWRRFGLFWHASFVICSAVINLRRVSLKSAKGWVACSIWIKHASTSWVCTGLIGHVGCKLPFVARNAEYNWPIPTGVLFKVSSSIGAKLLPLEKTACKSALRSLYSLPVVMDCICFCSSSEIHCCLWANARSGRAFLRAVSCKNCRLVNALLQKKWTIWKRDKKEPWFFLSGYIPGNRPSTW